MGVVDFGIVDVHHVARALVSATEQVDQRMALENAGPVALLVERALTAGDFPRLRLTVCKPRHVKSTGTLKCGSVEA